jgi:cytochrome c oxidase cbb3-type subunit 3
MKKWIPYTAVAAVAVLVLASVVVAEGGGKELFDRKCAMCHGKDGVAKTMAKGAGNFNDPTWQAANSAAAIDQVITNGKGTKMMPYKEKLKPEEIKALAEYIKTLSPPK